MKCVALIVGQDIAGQSRLRSMLEISHGEIAISGVVASTIEGQGLINEIKPDILFWDVNVLDENGLEFLCSIPRRKFELILISGQDQSAALAFKTGAVGFLLKPIMNEELQYAITRALKNISHQDQDSKVDSIFKNLFLVARTEVKIVNTREIIYLKADGNYTHFFLEPSKKVTVTKQLSQYEKELDTRNFLRVHRSALINLDYLVSYTHKNGIKACMKTGHEIAVSRRKAGLFLERVNSYCRHTIEPFT